MNKGRFELGMLAIMLACVTLIVWFGLDRRFEAAVVAAEVAADWLGFWGALIGALATIFAGGAAVWATQRGTSEQRTADVIALLASERERISLRMPGLQDAVELAALLANRATWPEWDRGRQNMEVFAMFCLKSMASLTEWEEFDVRKHVEIALPRTEEPIRIEFTRLLEELRAVFGWQSVNLTEERESRQDQALNMAPHLLSLLMGDLDRAASTYRAAENAIAVRVQMVSESHAVASPAAEIGPAS